MQSPLHPQAWLTVLPLFYSRRCCCRKGSSLWEVGWQQEGYTRVMQPQAQRARSNQTRSCSREPSTAHLSLMFELQVNVDKNKNVARYISGSYGCRIPDNNSPFSRDGNIHPSAFSAFGAATQKLIKYGSLSSSCQYSNGHVQGVFLA